MQDATWEDCGDRGALPVGAAEAIERCACAVMVLGRDHRVLAWNHGCERLTGVPAAEMLGTTRQWSAFYEAPAPTLADLLLDEATASDLAAHYQGRLQRVEAMADGWIGQAHFRGPTRSGRWLRFAAAPLHDDAGDVAAAVALFGPVTSPTFDAADLRALRRDLERMLRDSAAEGGGAVRPAGDEVAVDALIDSVGTLSRYLEDLLRLVAAYQTRERGVAAAPAEDLVALEATIGLDLLRRDAPARVRALREGLAWALPSAQRAAADPR